MDALSEALNSVRMTGAIFYHAVCTSPWGFAIPPLRDYAHLLAPKTERLVSYHLMTEGDAIARFGNGRDVPITAGDLLIVPHGDPHVVSNGRAPKIVDTVAHAARRKTPSGVARYRSSSCPGGRIRVGGRLHTRLQAGIRTTAGEVQEGGPR